MTPKSCLLQKRQLFWWREAAFGYLFTSGNKSQLRREMSQTYQALIQACLRHEASAQRQLYEQFAPQLMAVCYRYASDESLAEDILQEGFLKIFQHLDRYQDQGTLEAWMRRIIVNTAIDQLRRRKRQRGELELNEAIVDADVEDALDHLEASFLLEMIQRLPDGYRLVFNLYAIEGYSHVEIAKQLDISESTSRSQYARARSQLQRLIKAAYQEKTVYRDVI
jgi:RNA polymerase sigma-70 factor (ECF subfamily)